MEKLSSQQLQQLKNELKSEKEQTEKRLRQNEHFGLKRSERDMSGELSTSDNLPADVGTDVYERGKDVALNEHAEQYLDDINRALDEIAYGRYGICRTCGTPIPYARLQTIPTTKYCKEHAPTLHSAKSAPRDRPIEEAFLTPPFGRTSLDERSDQNQFDGEDAWQIVESWGTSNTPAMAENPDESSDYNHMFIEADELEGYVETMESFLATDIHGNHTSVVRNRQYRQYMHSEEGDRELEVATADEEEL